MRDNPTRVCIRCGRDLPSSEFRRQLRDGKPRGLYRRCISCQDADALRRRPIPLGDGTALVTLSKDRFAIIDVEDAERVGERMWQARQCKARWYAVASFWINGKRRTVGMHRFLLDPPDGMVADHRDGDGLNNRRSNLRVATYSQNGANSVSSQGFKGVSEDRRTGRWRAMICVDGQDLRLGFFATPEEAARAYDAAAKRFFGEFALVNFRALSAGDGTEGER